MGDLNSEGINRREFISLGLGGAAGVVLSPYASGTSYTIPRNQSSANPDTSSAAVDEVFLEDLDAEAERIIIEEKNPYFRKRLPPIKLESNMVSVDSIVENAANIYPASQEYLGLVVDANMKHQDIFPLPLEYFFGLIQQESRFNPYAVSVAFAMGFGQFMRGTARDLGMNTYHDYNSSDARDLQGLETEIRRLQGSANRLISASRREFPHGDLELAREWHIEGEKTRDEWRYKLGKEYSEMFADIIEKRGEDMVEFDERTSPKAIERSAFYVSTLCRATNNYFGGNPLNALIWGLSAYNAGLGNVRRRSGVPDFSETKRFLSEIMVNSNEVIQGRRIRSDNNLWTRLYYNPEFLDSNTPIPVYQGLVPAHMARKLN